MKKARAYRPALALFWMLCWGASTALFSQQKTVSGNITDENGLPLPGATVVEQGTNNGTTTDFDGNYQINVAQNAILEISYVGYQTMEIDVSDQIRADVTLQTESELDEVVVLGYSTKSKSEVTGSAVQLGSDEIENFPVTSADQILQGRVAGLSLSGVSGTPGSVQNILIRGRSSITAGNGPLYVIDGVPVNSGGIQRSTARSSFSPLANLNADNIESITVLKDPSSTATYGARGSNGVIVITTKKGAAGKAEINAGILYGWSNDATNGPEMLTGSQREELFYEGLYNTYGESEGFTREEAKNFYEENPNRFGRKYIQWNEQGRPETRWQDVISNKDAPYKELNVSARGGKDATTYFTSFEYSDVQATVIGAHFNRMNGTLNLDLKLSDNFNIETKNNVGYAEQDGILEMSAYFSGPRTAKYFMPPIEKAYNDDGTPNITNLNSNVRNPIYITENDVSLTKVLRINSINKAHWDTPVDNLDFDSTFSIDHLNVYLNIYGNRVHGSNTDTQGYALVNLAYITNYVIQNSLTYNFDLDLHKFDIKLLQEFQKNRFRDISASGEEFAADGLKNLASAGKPVTASSQFTDWSIGSYLALLNYSYNKKYVFNASYRREGNSRFPKEGRWGDFWSVGVAWNLHQESFFEEMDFVNSLKLRSSFGVTGNADIDLNTYQSSLSYDANYDGSAAIYPGTFGNDNLRWETSDSFEIGLDFNLFNSKLSGAVNYYRRESKDMLQQVPLSRTSGFVQQNQNVGRMENKGFELELTGTIIDRKDFNFNLGGNLGTNRNVVLELAKDGAGEDINITDAQRRVAVGHEVYEWYMVSFAGVDPQTGNALYYVDEKREETTTNFTDAARAYQGAGAIPKLLIGGFVHLDYKGLFLDANFNYVGGHKVWESWSRYTNGSDRWTTDLFNGVNKLTKRWQKPGDITDIPKITHTLQPWRQYSRFLYDGDYIRLRNVTLGYNIKSDLTKKIGVTNASVFLRGTNLYTWVKDKRLEFDPEVEGDGYISLTTPPVKTIVLGLNFKL